MSKEILLPQKVKRELKNTFKIGNYTVLRDYLTFKSNSATAKVIRAAAIQRGGLIYTGEKAPNGYVPNCTTRHENGIMYQTFGNGIEFAVNLDTGSASATIVDNNGNTVKHRFSEMTIADWGNALYSLQQIYNRLNS